MAAWNRCLSESILCSWNWLSATGRRLLGLGPPPRKLSLGRKNSYRIIQRESSVSSISSMSSNLTPRKSTRKLKPLRKKSSKSLRQTTSSTDPHLAIKQLLSAPKKKKILVLDLDETLIHSTSKGSKNHDHLIEVLIDKHVCL